MGCILYLFDIRAETEKVKHFEIKQYCARTDFDFEDLFHSASDSQEAAVIISLEKICFICACSIFLVCRRSSTERACARFSWLFSSSFFLREDVVFAQWEGSFERWTTDGHEHVEVVSFDYSRVLDFLSLVSAISRLSFTSGLFLT